jgi:hypothetical protein
MCGGGEHVGVRPPSKLYTYIKYHICTHSIKIETGIRARVFNARLLARSQFTARRSCDRPNRSGFSMVLLGHKANTELVPKFHVALHASLAALPMLTSKISP